MGEADDEAQRVPEHPATVLSPQKPFIASDAITFRHFSGATGDFLFPEILGSGVAVLDYDRDGDLDLYLIQGNRLDSARPSSELLFPLPPSQSKGNMLLRNELIPGGTLAFTDVTRAAGVGLDAYGMGAAVGDYDNDGDPDIYVTNLEDNVLYRNNGDGTFTDVTTGLNANLPTWSTSAAFLDYDRDGDLDLYVASYVDYSPDREPECSSASGNRDYCGPQNFTYAQDHLLRNDGEDGFTDVSAETGIASVRGPGLGVAGADFNADGYIDLSVANDGEANFLWMNQGGKSFRDTSLMSGVAFNRDGSAEAGMGISAGDYDGDGDEDLFMTHLVNETNTLYENDGRGFFSDVTDVTGLGFTSRLMTGFGTAWFDFDNDGWLDLYAANGDVKVEEVRSQNLDYPFDQPNQLFRNLGTGSFETVDGGDATGASRISRGVAFGDIDNDGDTDLVVSNNSGPARLFLNQQRGDVEWLRLRLIGRQSNRDAFGARIALLRENEATLWRRVHTDGSYLSASDPRVTVGLGAASRVNFIGVIWPSGLRESFSVPGLRQELVLVEGNGSDWE
ncbi:MAG: CRTAC1 family protein [Pseudomonadota bacterium]